MRNVMSPSFGQLLLVSFKLLLDMGRQGGGGKEEGGDLSLIHI